VPEVLGPEELSFSTGNPFHMSGTVIFEANYWNDEKGTPPSFSTDKKPPNGVDPAKYLWQHC